MFEPLTFTVVELAARWNRTPRQILEYALHRHMPVLFAFHGFAFNVADEWLRTNGDHDVTQEREFLKQNISAMELQLCRHKLYIQGQIELDEFEPRLANHEVQDLCRQITTHREQCERLSEKLRQREVERGNRIWNGLLRAAPATLQLVAVRGHAPFPRLAYDPNKDVAVVSFPKRKGLFLDGHLLALEDPLEPVGDLTAESLYVSTIDVKAVEAASTPVPISARVQGSDASATTKQAEWKVKAQEIAASYLEKHRAAGLAPNQADVAKHVANTLKKLDVRSQFGKTLTAAYIQRNVLQGKWWREN
jgi:hypothetical protein